MNDSLKTKILTELVEPCYYSDVNDLIDDRKVWRKCGNIFETLSKLAIGSSSIISFASGIYDYKILAFASGITSVLALVFMQFSSYSFKESKERTKELDKLLIELKINIIQDISDNE